MYELLSGLLLALGGSVITLGIQRIIRCVNRPILEASIVYGNDSGGAGRVLRIKNKGKSVMDGLSVEVDLEERVDQPQEFHGHLHRHIGLLL